MGYITQLKNVVLGKKKSDIVDAVKYNSYENVNKLHLSFEHFKIVKKSSTNHVKNLFRFIKSKNINLDNKSIVDVGCGPGILLNLISKEYPKSTLKGLDFSDTKIANSRKVYPHIDFEAHSIYDRYDAEYDVVICTEVLEHLEYPEKALRNLLAMMNSQCVLIVTVPNGRIDTFDGHIYFWSNESWKLFVESVVDDVYTIQLGMFNNQRNNYVIISKK